eukprot:6201646-Pleurochrysis_carterae.AAC.1
MLRTVYVYVPDYACPRRIPLILMLLLIAAARRLMSLHMLVHTLADWDLATTHTSHSGVHHFSNRAEATALA